MLINGIDISIYGAKLYDRVLNSNQVDTIDDWLDGDIQPTNIRQQERFRNIQLSFLILGTDEEDAFFRISKLTKALKQASIVFDDIDLVFDVSLLGSANTQRLKNGNFIVSYEFHSDYAKGQREIYTTDANLTNAFRLNLLYYQDQTQLLSSEAITIRASSFSNADVSLADLGIDVNKYQPNFYNNGIATNLNGIELTYENLQYLGTLIINYAPTEYTIQVRFMMGDEAGVMSPLLLETLTFTYPQLQKCDTIGQLINPKRYKPEGYRAVIPFEDDLTVTNLLAASPITVLYEKVLTADNKNVIVNYYMENDNEGWTNISSDILNIVETEIYDGVTLQDIININKYQPNVMYYNNGYIEDHQNTELLTFDTIEATYDIYYPRLINSIFVEYYAGTYPSWSRISSTVVPTKYKESYDTDFDISELDIDLNKYHTSEYHEGAIYNINSYETYDNVLSAGVIQVYYVPIDYTIHVRFQKAGEQTYEDVTQTIRATDFFNAPVLTDIIPIQQYRPEGYQLDTTASYSGEVTLSALTQASPIYIVFEEIEAERTKNVLVHYKKELSSVYSTINTILITINESDCIGGVRLKDLINLNAYKPDYYENGQLNGQSSTQLLTYDNILSDYTVHYMASTYSTPVRYYTDDIDDLNWIGSSSIDYRIIDFEITTTLFDLGLNINSFKPAYCADGEVQYNGPINFEALRSLESINVIYETVQEPGGGDDDIDYPHRFLFLQHNDLGAYEGEHPQWTMNHAFINTGVTANDASKLTIIMECKRVDQNVPLHDVNGPYGYLFGSSSGTGSFFMRFNNQTKHRTGTLSGVNTYEAKAGLYTPTLSITEESAIGFSRNTGIYSSARDGYSYATFTYTNPVATENARISYPIYLFANNEGGVYSSGLAGIGIYGCRIYYDNALIRDMIPVQYYDKIGDLVAPSNCLYDKVTKTFFEDGTGLNSFNIIDDEDYEDNNPEHKIGQCYVNYYQNDVRFRTVIYYFRASDFIDQVYDPYTKWRVDENQPSYYKSGVIENFNSIDPSFNGLNGKSFNVRYEEKENTIVVNYYKRDNGEDTLLASDTIAITEKDFYQVPSFGDIVRLNKYKPAGYKTDYEFPEPKVSLSRVLNHTPYSIIYTEETEPLETYTTTIRYIKKVYGLRTYETIGETTLTLDQTNFREGEYIDYYIDFNLMRPQNYYSEGARYQWYEYDTELTDPSKLREEYVIVYNTVTQYLTVNYYTDDWDEENLIASTTWAFKLDDFDPEYPFYLVDQLPNNYINRYRPANCDGGVLQNSNTQLSFYDLVQLEEIAIVYDTLVEPHDPEEAYYENKVLYWGDLCNRIYPSEIEILQGLNNGTVLQPYRIPYIDLGYKPKELGRLRVEFTGASKPIGCLSANISGRSGFETSYTAFFGYVGPTPYKVEPAVTMPKLVFEDGIAANETSKTAEVWKGSLGNFYIRSRLPEVDGYWVYTANGPSAIDGQGYANSKTNETHTTNLVYYIKPGMIAGYRKGAKYDVDDNYHNIDVFHDYQYSKSFNVFAVEQKLTDGYMQVNSDRFTEQGLHSYDDNEPWDGQDGTWKGDYFFANPFSVVLDAHNNYCSIWNYHDSATPLYTKFTDTDNPIWEDIERPRGSLSLYTTTNPTTGKPNYLDGIYYAPPGFGASLWGGPLATASLNKDPYYDTDYGTITFNEDLIVEAYGSEKSPSKPGTTDSTSGEKAEQVVSREQTIYNRYAGWNIPCLPWQAGGILWSLKIYDRDRLVRDLVPVAKGDEIYDYIMPDNGLFDLVTEIFFGDSNPGKITNKLDQEITYTPARLYAIPDILSYGKITTNYYDYDNTYINSKWVNVPTWFCGGNTTIEEILEWNDFKPDAYHLDGWLDVDADYSYEDMSLAEIYELGTANIYYRLRTYTKTVVYYQSNKRIGSRDFFYSLEDINNARSLDDLGINLDLYYDSNFAHGRVIFNEQLLQDNDIEGFINAPSPVVVYDKLSKEAAPNLFYAEYYRGGAYDNNLITLDEDNVNYLNCDLTGRVLNPSGAILYDNHYHWAMYEDEDFGEFIPYQVRVLNKYTGLHYGPGRKYKTLSMIILQDTYTIIQERNGWGRLREYPNAWILLSATEAITGPGLNPAYDIAGSGTPTVPYGENVVVTRMTNDRLWSYVETYHSWIKSEDISLDQAGRLFNSLAIEVIDLNEIDFSQVATFEDVIDPQKYKLKFHNNATNPFVGTLTLESFADQHQLDFVYPEKIYTYSCIYYRDNRATENRLGTSAFSCSISDWNPDWDTFIETSWRKIEILGEGHWQNKLNLRETPALDGNVLAEIPANTPFYILSSEFENGTTSWYKVKYASYEGYVDSSVVTVDSAYGGIEDKDPVLYRDTVLTLTWDYFGFDRNLYRPTGYGDGIYLWNPRSWDKDNIKFSFEELITCGTQYVVYPSFEPDMYKIYIKRNYLGLYYNDVSNNTTYVFNPGIPISLGTVNNTEYTTKQDWYWSENHKYEIYMAGEHRGDLGNGSATYPRYTTHFGTFASMMGDANATTLADRNKFGGISGWSSFGYPTFNTNISTGGSSSWAVYNADLAKTKSKDKFIINVSRARTSPSCVYGIGNDYEQREMRYYIPRPGTDYAVPLLDTTRLTNDFSHLEYAQSDTYKYHEREYLWRQNIYGVAYSVVSYDNHLMIHYWTPVPRGLPYTYNGVEYKMPDNGLYDLLTNTFKTSFRWSTDFKAPAMSQSELTNYSHPEEHDGEELIFLKTQEIAESSAYSYFNDWEFDESNVYSFKQVSADTTVYQKPSIYANKVNDIVADLIVPCWKKTEDTTHDVEGVWYFIGSGWVQGSALTDYATPSGYSFTQQNTTYLPVNGTGAGYAYLNPTATSTLVGRYGTDAYPMTFYATYTSSGTTLVFDGTTWLNQRYTSNDTMAPPYENYVVSRTLPYYQYPIEDNNYRIDSYSYGERIHINYVTRANNRWGYTGLGWVYLADYSVSPIES